MFSMSYWTSHQESTGNSKPTTKRSSEFGVVPFKCSFWISCKGNSQPCPSTDMWRMQTLILNISNRCQNLVWIDHRKQKEVCIKITDQMYVGLSNVSLCFRANRSVVFSNSRRNYYLSKKKKPKKHMLVEFRYTKCSWKFKRMPVTTSHISLMWAG